jgi:hypothetical protein
VGFLSKIFGIKSVDYKSLSNAGAIIIDVRTSAEFASGHIKGSKNIELQQLKNQLIKIPKDKVIITCCASGMRSASAKSILLQNGFPEVHNGGGWMSLQNKL